MNRRLVSVVKVVAVNFAIALILVVLGILGLEAYLRLTIPASSGESIFQSTLTTPRYKIMRPNTKITAWGKEFGTNELGFRDDKARIPEKTPGEFRIIVLGDSMTVGAGVEYDLIYTTLLEKRLQQGRRHVRVINLAVGGYNVIQYALVLDEVGLALTPDLILVGLFPTNDFSNDTYEENQRVAAGIDAPESRRWYETWLVYPAFVAKIEHRVRRWLRPDRSNASVAGTGMDQIANVAALKSILDRGRARGVPVVVAMLPYTGALESQRPAVAQVKTYCKDLQVECLDLLEVFIRSGVNPRSLRLNLVDDHPNAQYNVMVADAIAAHLEALRVVTGDTGSATPDPRR